MPVGMSSLHITHPATDLITTGGKRRNAADSGPNALVARVWTNYAPTVYPWEPQAENLDTVCQHGLRNYQFQEITRLLSWGLLT